MNVSISSGNMRHEQINDMADGGTLNGRPR